MKKLLALIFWTLCGTYANAQVNALTCSNMDVQTAINSATTGQTVNIPAGSCTWTNLTLAKAITLNGAGQGVTNITLSNTVTVLLITKQVAGVTRLQNITWNATNFKGGLHAVSIGGPWPTGQPVIFYNDTLNLNSADFATVSTAGGVIFSHITQNGTLGDNLFTGKDVQNTASWTTASSLGTLDSTGFYNVYIEDNIFNGGNITDCDDACRVVLRHNLCYTCGGFNSHGEDTSPQGMRQFDIYSNSFLFTNPAGVYQGNVCPSSLGNSAPSNINQWIWIRGGTGYIHDNNFDPLYGGCWGDKAEIKLANRGAEDARPQGACGSVSYPVPHQIGQGDNGSSTILDPIYFSGNVSNSVSWAPGGVDPNKTLHIEVSSGWEWGNPCAFNWNTFFQWGRDAINTTLGSPVLPSGGGSVEGIGGTAKPGYTAYPYPHPLAAGTATPIISFSPLTSGAVAFGTVNVGSTSAPVTVTIANVGSATETYTNLALGGTNASDWARTGGTCAIPSGTIAQSASCTWIGTFTPAAQGARSATLTLTGTVSASATLSGTGQTSISIPSVPTGLTATAIGAAVNLTWSASTGTPDHYNVSRGTVTGGPYTQIASPTTNSYSDTGLANGTYFYVVSAHNTAGTSANSTQASATVNTQPNAGFFPPSLAFVGIQGLVTVAQNVTLTNTGTAILSSIVVANPSGPNGADFAQTNNCSSTLAINASCTIAVTYTASLTTPESASLVITSNDPDGPDTVTLTGTSQAAISLTPTSLNFGNIFVKKISSAQTATFTNNSGQIITFASVTVSGGDSSQFVKGTDTCTGTPLTSGLSCTVDVSFQPTTAGSKVSALVFTFSGAGTSPMSVTLTGSAKAHHVAHVL